MSRTMYIAAMFVLLLLIPGRDVQAEDGPVRTTAASFLKMSVGARAMAMGGTGVAGRDEPWAAFVNPAILGERRGNSLAFSYHRFPFEVEQMALGSAFPLGARGALGLGMIYVRVGDIEVRTGIKDDGPEAIAEASDLALCGGYSRELIQGLHVGVGGKFLQEKLHEDKASSFVLDLGARVAHELLDIGVAFRNVGEGIRFGEESFSPPMMAILGIGVPLFGQRVRMAADFEEPLVEGNRSKLRVGCEARLLNLYVRAGYTHTFGAHRPDAWTGWTAGVGFLYDRWEVDYGMAPSEVLGDVHQVSMAMRSGASPLQIYITSPADGDTVHEARAHLKGFVEGEEAQAVQIKVNNETIKELHSERGIRVVWRKEVSLREGDNALKVTAETVGGQRATSTVKVVYTPRPIVMCS